jgi:NRAMP (natural resistance-associated macrophage protein)-like metal ion transporter
MDKIVTTQQENEARRQHRHHPRKRGSRLLFYLGIFGPGLIAANAGNDPGGIYTYSTMGSQFGYQMLWTLVVLTVGMAIVQEMASRMGAVTGKGLSDLIRENFPLRLTAFIMLIFLVANGGVIVSEFIGITTALGLFGVPGWIAAPLGGLLIWLLVARGSYARVERVFLALTFTFFAYIISAFLAKPDWGRVAAGTLIPTVQLNGSYILTLVAATGTTISPYMQLYVQSAVVDRGISMKDYKYERFEVYVGAVFSNAVAFFIVVATAATLYVHSGGKGVVLSSAADAAQALTPFLGVFARDAFALGLIGAAFLAAAVLPLSTSYSIAEALGLERGVDRRWREAPFFWTLFTLLILIGVVIAMVPNLPVVQILLNLYMLNGLLLPIILFTILRLVNDKRLMGLYTNGLIYNILAYTLTIVVSLLAVLYLVIQVLGIFGIQILG